MFGLVLNALRARRPQAAALFALTVLAALGAAAAPWFLAWAKDSVADANIAAAPPAQRVLDASGSIRYDLQAADPPSEVLRSRVSPDLVIPGATPVVGARVYVNMAPVEGTPGAASGLYLAYRDDVCAQLRIEGRCPQADGEVIIGRSTADALGVAVGDEVVFEGFRLPEPVRLTISGLYEVTDLLGTYWAETDLLAGPTGLFSAVVDDPAFVSERTLLSTRPDGLDMDVHLMLPPAAFHPGQFDLLGAVNQASNDLREISFDLETQATQLADQVRRDQRLVGDRHHGRGDATGGAVLVRPVPRGAAHLRGAPARHRPAQAARRRSLAGVGADRAAERPADGRRRGAGLGAGLPGGGRAGPGSHRPGRPRWTPIRPPRSRLSLLASALACVGALVAAAVAEWRSLQSPVVGLLRRVPARHRGWRAEVLDLVVVLVAVVGVYQGHVEASSASGAVHAGPARAGPGRPRGRAARGPRAALAGRVPSAALRCARAGPGLPWPPCIWPGAPAPTGSSPCSPSPCRCSPRRSCSGMRPPTRGRSGRPRSSGPTGS